jgi:hypothetical protein
MPTAAYAQPAPSLGHSPITVQRYFGMHAFGALFPLTAGLLFFGWRAAVTVAIVLLAAAGALFVWRRIGLRGGQLRYAHGLWLALLLALMLPAHLAVQFDADPSAIWPILPAGSAPVEFIPWSSPTSYWPRCSAAN